MLHSRKVRKDQNNKSKLLHCQANLSVFMSFNSLIFVSYFMELELVSLFLWRCSRGKDAQQLLRVRRRGLTFDIALVVMLLQQTAVVGQLLVFVRLRQEVGPR